MESRRRSGRRSGWLFAGALAVGGSAAAILYGTYAPDGDADRAGTHGAQARPVPSASHGPTASASPAATPSASPSRTAPSSAPPSRPTAPASPSASHAPSVTPSSEKAGHGDGERERGDRRPHRPSRPGHGGGGGVLMPGSEGAGVADLQRRLQELSLYMGSADGRYSPEVGLAVGRYQRARALTDPPGVYGPATRAMLEEETSGG